jgi:hypothetical protein
MPLLLHRVCRGQQQIVERVYALHAHKSSAGSDTSTHPARINLLAIVRLEKASCSAVRVGASIFGRGAVRVAGKRFSGKL